MVIKSGVTMDESAKLRVSAQMDFRVNSDGFTHGFKQHYDIETMTSWMIMTLTHEDTANVTARFEMKSKMSATEYLINMRDCIHGMIVKRDQIHDQRIKDEELIDE